MRSQVGKGLTRRTARGRQEVGAALSWTFTFTGYVPADIGQLWRSMWTDP